MRHHLVARARRCRTAVASACAAAVSLACLLVPSSASAAGPDVVLRWEDQFLRLSAAKNAFLTDPNTGATIQGDNPPATSREMAILNTSMFNAINAFDGRYQMYGGGPGVTPAAGASREAAAIEAARVSMRQMFPNTSLYPNRANQVDGLAEGMIEELFDRGVSESAVNAGRTVGAAAANHIMTLRQNDGSGPTATWADSTQFGKYRTDTFGAQTNAPAAEPQWGGQSPWALNSPSQFRRNNIPAFTSAEYAQAVEQTRTLGNIARYQGDNLDAQAKSDMRTAFFWAQKGLDSSGSKVATGTTTPPGQWLQIARSVAGTRNGDLLDNARLMALVSIAEADAGIAAWDMKFAPENNLWRPIHAIRFAAQPGDEFYNAGITRDTAWSPLIPTSNHPEYVSGHSTFSGAAAQLLTMYFGSDVNFTVAGDDALWINSSGEIVPAGTPGATKETRTYSDFWSAANEAGMSRIYGGLHYSFSNTNGLIAGSEIGDWVFANSLAAVPEPMAISLLAPAVLLLARRRRDRLR